MFIPQYPLIKHKMHRRLLVPEGDASMPALRAMAAEDARDEASLTARRRELADELAKGVLTKLEGKSPEELDKIGGVWGDPNFQYLLANNP